MLFRSGCRHRHDGPAVVFDLPDQRAGDWLRLKLADSRPLTIHGAALLADETVDGCRQIDLVVPAESEFARVEPRRG